MLDRFSEGAHMMTKYIPAGPKEPKTARVLMFDVSLPWAIFWYDAFNVLLFAGAVAIAVGTYGSIKMGAVKERFFDERTTALETQTEQAKAELGKAQADIAQAKVQIAEANARALEAQAALEKFKAPRTLTTDQQQHVVAKTKPWAGLSVSFSVASEPESIALLHVIRGNLASAGWVLIASQMGDLEIDGAGVATASGVEIQVHPSSAHRTNVAGAANALAQALVAEGIVAVTTANPQLKYAEAINVVVGKKP
jgi:hypothetical protein